jgi:hypothetical protein
MQGNEFPMSNVAGLSNRFSDHFSSAGIQKIRAVAHCTFLGIPQPGVMENHRLFPTIPHPIH